MPDPMIGVLIHEPDAASAVARIQAAEDAGIRAAWSTMGGADNDDTLTTFAAALAGTERILLGTAIVQTWPRHPLTTARQALALESLGPGRFRLGIGPGHETMIVQTYGIEFAAPLTNLREHLTVIRTLLHEGEVDFEGRQVTARSSIRTPVQTPVMASALRPRSFELCGELADGAISWVCPRTYLVEQALPAIRRGAEAAGRPPPPLIAHVPVCVHEDREAAGLLAREQLSNYTTIPFYRAMFDQAGFDVDAAGYSDALLADLVVSGGEDEVAAGLAAWIEAGMGEVIAAPVLDPADREGSLGRAYDAIVRASGLLTG